MGDGDGPRRCFLIHFEHAGERHQEGKGFGGGSGMMGEFATAMGDGYLSAWVAGRVRKPAPMECGSPPIRTETHTPAL